MKLSSYLDYLKFICTQKEVGLKLYKVWGKEIQVLAENRELERL